MWIDRNIPEHKSLWRACIFVADIHSNSSVQNIKYTIFYGLDCDPTKCFLTMQPFLCFVYSKRTIGMCKCLIYQYIYIYYNVLINIYLVLKVYLISYSVLPQIIV